MDGSALTLRVTASSPHRLRVTTRSLQFDVGRPLEFDAAAPHPSAVECAVAALGAEIVGGLQVFAKRRRLTIDAAEALVQARIDAPLLFLEVIGERGDPRLAAVWVKVFVASPDDPDAIRRAFDAALVTLPLTATLRAAVQLQIELIVTP
jgi:hypothetical protein